MKLSTALVALLPIAAAAKDHAQVYLLRSQQSIAAAETPSLPRQLARLVFLQRLSRDGRAGAGSLDDLPTTLHAADAVSYLERFGNPPAPLLVQDSKAATSSAPQLLVLIEGVTSSHVEDLRGATSGFQPAFTVLDTPGSSAHKSFVEGELAVFDAVAAGCSAASILAADDSCAIIGNRVARFDAQKNPEVVSLLAKNLEYLTNQASTVNLETTIVLIPESTRNSRLATWSTNPIKPQPLQARQLFSGEEEVMSETDNTLPPSSASNPSPKIPFYPGAADRGVIAACYQSLNGCETATHGCSGHGVCEDRYAPADGSPSKEKDPKCFACRCQGTKGDGTNGYGYTHWAGPTCAKVDVSAPFWLFVGLTLGLVAVVTLAVGMLFSVGEEKLPGVIGAGVSRNK